jgi:Short C-terminal domain
MLRRRPLMRAAATTAVVAGTATAVSGRVNRRQQNRYQQEADAQAYQDQQMAAAPPAYAPAAPVAAPAGGLGPDVIEQLQALAGLRDQGVLTEEEFAAQKAKLLG